MIDIIPKFIPRPYQIPIMRSFLVDGIKRQLLIQHRRCGKDTLAWNLTWMKAIELPGLYLYLLPVISQSASVIWHGRGKNSISFRDYIPSQFIERVNHSTMSIYLTNGSIIRVTGSNNWESLIGVNCRGLVLSEYQSSDERAYNLLRPILAENNGWCIFTATPRGFNKLYDLYQQNKDNPDWNISLLTVDDTRDWDGSHIISPQTIDEERRAGMPENIIQQEFFLSWIASLTGAYYADEMKAALDSGRIGDFDIDPNIEVFTSWDLGISDCTSICLFQVSPRDGSVTVIYHWEEGGKELAHYAFELEQLKHKLGFKRYGQHFLPHDVRVRELGSGRTRLEQLQKCGMSPRIVGNHLVIERIQCVRTLLPKVRFNEKHCKHLIRALSEYRANYDEKNKVSRGPVHDNFSHAADAFGYYAVGFSEWHDPEGLALQKEYASFMP